MICRWQDVFQQECLAHRLIWSPSLSVGLLLPVQVVHLYSTHLSTDGLSVNDNDGHDHHGNNVHMVQQEKCL